MLQPCNYTSETAENWWLRRLVIQAARERPNPSCSITVWSITAFTGGGNTNRRVLASIRTLRCRSPQGQCHSNHIDIVIACECEDVWQRIAYLQLYCRQSQCSTSTTRTWRLANIHYSGNETKTRPTLLNTSPVLTHLVFLP